MKYATRLNAALTACLLFAAVFSANLATAQTVIGSRSYPELPRFQFDILVSNCYNGGSTLTVHIAKPELYWFYWEIDGAEGGRGITTATCVCGEVATVRVIRKRDGAQVVRRVSLPNSCSPGSRL